MDFILGIFTGMFFMIALGAWLNEKGKKRGAPKNQPPAQPEATGLGIFLDGKWIGILKSDDHNLSDIGEIDFMRRVKGYRTAMNFAGADRQSLEEQLQAAIDRDDFEEAARIRDLMNKQ